jgi:hypothetical protein
MLFHLFCHDFINGIACFWALSEIVMILVHCLALQVWSPIRLLKKCIWFLAKCECIMWRSFQLTCNCSLVCQFLTTNNTIRMWLLFFRWNESEDRYKLWGLVRQQTILYDVGGTWPLYFTCTLLVTSEHQYITCEVTEDTVRFVRLL